MPSITFMFVTDSSRQRETYVVGPVGVRRLSGYRSARPVEASSYTAPEEHQLTAMVYMVWLYFITIIVI